MNLLSKILGTSTSTSSLSRTPFSLKCLSVVMPVYNEVYTLQEIVKRVAEVPVPKEIIIIDDGSKDGTRDTLQKLIEQHGADGNLNANTKLKIIFNQANMGKGACIRVGIQHATGDLLIVQDADLEYDPEEYPKLIEPILAGDADVVFGSRFRGERQRVLHFWHTLGNKFLTLLSNVFTNLNLTDMETCYKVFRTEIIKAIPLRSQRFGFEPEITAKMAKLRCRIYEVPISYHGRTYAEGKKINWKDGISAVWTILRFWIQDDLYPEGIGLKTLQIMEGAGRYNGWLFRQCEAYLGRRVVEVGSGVGNITKYLINRDSVVATETNRFYLEELNRQYASRHNIQVLPLDILDQAAAQEIGRRHNPDTALAFNVLENIDDDKKAAAHLNRMLTLGGRAVIVSPAHPALYCEMDKSLGHRRRYNERSITSLLEESGFQVEKVRYLNALGGLGWYLNGHLFRRKLIPSRQVRIFDHLVPLLAVERFLTPRFGLSILAVARKVREL